MSDSKSIPAPGATPDTALGPPLGATPLAGGRCRFAVWAPFAGRLSVRLLGGPEVNADRVVPMAKSESGYFETETDNAPAGTRYFYRLANGSERPDPASRFQPDGVHGPSQVVDVSAFQWTDAAWQGLDLEDSVFYELHVGT
ncbi:MAG: hypothetical protein ABLQ96_03395, partial [Candidatus Acidiferrum sp.]